MNVFSSHKKINTKICAVLLVLTFLVPVSAGAQTVNQFQPQTREQIIAYLYGQIVQLQILLAERLAQESAGDCCVNDSVSSSRSDSDIDVTTLSAVNIESNEADLRAEVDLNGEDEALVWFEYGQSSNRLNERTSKKRITDSRGDEVDYEVTIDDLDADERYYFRVVAEDESGDRAYGATRSFSTDEEDSSSDDFELVIPDRSVGTGDRLIVEWRLPEDDVDSQNWIGVYETDADNEDFVVWKYITTEEGETFFRINEEGTYELRLFLDNSYDDEITSRTFEIVD